MVSVPASAGPHATALKAQLVAAGLSVGYGRAPASASAPYVVLYPDSGTPEGTLGDRFCDLLMDFQVTAVGRMPEEAMYQADKARIALLGSVPTVTGRTVQPLWQRDSQPVLRDDDVTPPLFYATAQYQLRSEPA